jgi:type I restriction enzyme S subunit
MAADWRTFRLEDIAAQTRNALVGGPFGSDLLASDYASSGMPVIRGENLAESRWVTGPFVFVTHKKGESLRANTAGPGDLIFTQRGANHYRQIALVPPQPYARYLISQSQMKLSVDETKVDAVYVYYWFRSPEQQDYLRQNAISTGVPHTNLGILRRAPIRFPSRPEQRAIARILGALDDKIELNRRTNETLEAMARAIFQSWFVDFDPVRAKMEGRQPEGMDRETARPFSSEFTQTEDTPLPKGWHRGQLGELLEIFDTKRIPLSKKEREQKPGTYPYHGAAGVMDHVGEYIFDGVYLLVGEDGSVITESGGAVLQYVWGKFWVNNHAHVLKGRGISTEQLLLILQHLSVRAYVSGAVQPKLTQGNLCKLPLVIAPSAINVAFGERIEPMFRSLRKNADETRTLASMRDTLLPKLLSGELRVPDAERAVEAALS